VHELVPVTEEQRRAVEITRALIWWFYADLGSPHRTGSWPVLVIGPPRRFTGGEQGLPHCRGRPAGRLAPRCAGLRLDEDRGPRRRHGHGRVRRHGHRLQDPAGRHDTPELRGRCPEERALAQKARDELIRLAAPGVTFVTDFATDRYGRVLGTTYLREGCEAGAVLIAKRLAHPDDGRGPRKG
jgi:hypothetical protein